MKESHARSLIKAISWRIFGTLSTMIITFIFTHQWSVTLYVGIFEFLSKIALFYVHERLWGRIKFGAVHSSLATHLSRPRPLNEVR